jgi:hypothetical protein
MSQARGRYSIDAPKPPAFVGQAPGEATAAIDPGDGALGDHRGGKSLMMTPSSHCLLNVVARHQDGSRIWIAPVNITRIIARQDDLPGSIFDFRSMLLKNLKNILVRDGPECAYEISARNAADNSKTPNVRIEPKFAIEPVFFNLPDVPSGILIVSQKVNIRVVSQKVDICAHVAPRPTNCTEYAPCHRAHSTTWSKRGGRNTDPNQLGLIISFQAI